jgi:ProP effector
MSSNELPPSPADVAPAVEASTAAAPKAAEPSPAAVAQQLKQLFPALFSGAPKPIKLRIQIDIQARAPGQFTKQGLSAFFRRHTGSTSYLQAVANGTQRFDLDGQPHGDITDEHRQVAATELARRRTNHLATQNASRAEAELKEQQRRNRAGLLHDYERTTLTRANFCVLKGVAEPELDGLLAIAREEAAQPRGPAPHDLHDPRRPPRPAPRPNLGGRHGR